MRSRLSLRLCAYTIAMVAWLLFSNSPAQAHRVTTFAWVEGDTVYTQSKFSGGRKAQNASIVVYDALGNRLLGGQTDANGEFSFKVPQKTEMRVVLKASTGHMAEWTIPVEEIVEETSGGKISAGVTSETAKTDPDNTPNSADDFKSERFDKPPAAVAIDPQKLEEMIESSLDKKLAPITRMLADAVNSGPGVTEILGGIGYIFGLVGIALYVANRRKNGR